MLIKEKYKLDICSDCFYYNEYGNIGDEHKECIGFDACETCKMCAGGFKKIGIEHGKYEIASNQDDPFFSWLRCDICESHLGGDRYEVNLLILESE